MAKQPLAHAQHRRQDGRKGQGRQPEILPGVVIRPEVMPVLDKPVQVFEKPPKDGAHRKQRQEEASLVGQQALPLQAVRQGVDEHNEAQPQGREGVRLPGGKPGKAGPGKDPKDQIADQPQPAPPGKRPGGRFAARQTGFCPFPPELEQKPEYCQNGDAIAGKDRPGKWRMLNIEGPGRKFQVATDRESGQIYPQQRQSQQHRGEGENLPGSADIAACRSIHAKAIPLHSHQ